MSQSTCTQRLCHAVPSCLPALILALSCVLADTAFAADPTTEAHACRSIADARARLACYDAAFGLPRVERAESHDAAPADETVPAAPPPPSQAPALSGVERFGLSEAELRARTGGQAAEPEQIEATIADVTRRGAGGAIFRLDNGQVWMQTDSRHRNRITAGQSITIRRAAMGSYLLSNGQVAVRVRRID